MRINWFSNAPWVSTGYGVQTKLFAPRIRDLGHEVSITSFFGLQGAPIYFDGMRVFPSYKHLYGQDIIGEHAAGAGAEVIVTLMDAWVVQPENIPANIAWVPWFPVDHEPISYRLTNTLKYAPLVITMSKHGQAQAEKAGLKSVYVPHGTDTKKFAPMDMKEARRIVGMPENAFIVGMVAANKGPRKAFFQQIAAFAALKQKHADAFLYLHTDQGLFGSEAVNLVDYCAALGLKPGLDVGFCDQYALTLSFSDEYMRAAYSAMDVHMLVSKGEGFGIPILEAQACGTPVITGDWTSMSELCFSGWKVKKAEAEQTWEPFYNAWQWQTRVEPVADRLFAAYEMRGNDDYRQRARAGAEAYDADKITEKYWKPALERIQEILDDSVSIKKVAE